MSKKLMPCPFCGGTANVKTRYIGYGSIGLGEHDEYRVACQECHASSDEYRHEAEAIAAWNRRAQPESDKRPAMNTAKNDFIEENDYE